MKNFAENISTGIGQFYKTSVLAMVDYSAAPSRLNNPTSSYSTGGSQFKKIKRFFKNTPYIPFVIVGAIVLIIATIVIRGFVNNHPKTNTLGASTNNQVNVAKPLAQQTLNKNFDFPLKDATGKVVSKFNYEILSAEEDNQIIIKGQIATAVQGKTFLLLNLKITNNYDKDVQLNTR